MTLYEGVHTKGEADGKFCTYRGYSYQFTDFELHDFRVGPNVFDLLQEDFDDEADGDSDGEADIEEIDIYFSYSRLVFLAPYCVYSKANWQNCTKRQCGGVHF